MIYNITVAILLLNLSLFSQTTVLFNTPPSNLTLPSILTEENGIPKTAGVGVINTKWITSADPNAENLMQLFSSSSDKGIIKIIQDIFVNANIPENKASRIKIGFTSSGIEEQSIDKESVTFNDDFSDKYPGENILLITKLFRLKNAVIELTDESSEEFDPAVRDALSDGLRIGNKSETIQGNKMIIESSQLIYSFEYQPVIINRTVDMSLVLPVYFTTDISLNSISSFSLGEGEPNDFFVKVGSGLLAKPVEFRISDSNPMKNFRIGSRESYTLKFIEKGNNKVTFSISGFMISF